MALLVFVVFLILAPLAERWSERRDEEQRNITRLAKASLKDKRRKYTWQSPGTGKNAGR